MWRCFFCHICYYLSLTVVSTKSFWELKSICILSSFNKQAWPDIDGYYEIYQAWLFLLCSPKLDISNLHRDRPCNKCSETPAQKYHKVQIFEFFVRSISWHLTKPSQYMHITQPLKINVLLQTWKHISVLQEKLLSI